MSRLADLTDGNPNFSIMVFYTLPKHLRRIRRTDTRATFFHLPDELLLQTLYDVDTQAVLYFRLTCADAVPLCNSVLQQRLKRLYLHPRNLQTALKICAHPVLKQSLEEIVLLGKPMWREIEKAYPEYRKSGQVNLRRGRQTSRCTTAFRAWLDDNETNQQLIDAIGNLPKLRKLGYAESVRQPGFNQPSQKSIDAYANKCRYQDHGVVPIGSKNGNIFESSCLTDADMFYALLFESGSRFEFVTVETKLPFIENILRSIIENDTRDTKIRALDSITDLEFALDCGWNENASANLYHDLICHMSKLQRLKITLVPNLSQKWPKPEHTLNVLLKGATMGALQSFEIEHPSAHAFNGRSRTGQHRRSKRPTCQWFDMTSFLSRHHRLSTVSFRNVVFCHNSSEHGYRTQHMIIADVLAVVKGSTTVKNFEWFVTSYKHDPRCKKADLELLDRCREFGCGRYGKI